LKEIVAIDDHKLREDLKILLIKRAAQVYLRMIIFRISYWAMRQQSRIARQSSFNLKVDADKQHRFDATKAFERYRSGLTPDRMCLFDCYTLKDLAFKAVGVGSVGTFCCIGLFMSNDGDPLFLQVKEAQRYLS
jgi:hypothetical protein